MQEQDPAFSKWPGAAGRNGPRQGRWVATWNLKKFGCVRVVRAGGPVRRKGYVHVCVGMSVCGVKRRLHVHRMHSRRAGFFFTV